MECGSWREKKQDEVLGLLTTFSWPYLGKCRWVAVWVIEQCSPAQPWKAEVFTLGETVLCGLLGIS